MLLFYVNKDMATLWALPSNFYQYSEGGAEDVDASWNEADFIDARLYDKKSLGITKQLYHISRSPKTDLTNHTYFLRATGFKFINLPPSLSGIEVMINARRAGRIMDHTVQLCKNGELVGENLASMNIDPEKTYGGPEVLWGTNLTLADIDENFGIILRFKAHPKWPHRDSIFIDGLKMRLY